MSVKEITDSLKKIDRKITKFVLEQTIEGSPELAIIFLIFIDAIGLLRAVIVLLNAKLVVESGVLVRSLLEVSIRLMYIYKKPKERIELLCGYQNEDFNKWMELSKQASKVALEQNPDRLQNFIKQKQKELRAFADRKRVKVYKKFPSEKQMAEELGITKAYLNYQLLSRYAHVSYSSGLERIQKKADKYNFRIHIDDTPLTHGVASEAAEWIIGAAEAVGNMLDIKELRNMRSLGKEGEEILHNASKLED